MKYELKEMNQGEIFSEAFNLYFDNFVALFVISFISAFPGFIYAQSVVNNTLAGSSGNAFFGTLMPMIFMVLANTIATALIIEVVSKKYLRKPQSMQQYISTILPFVLPIIGLSILQSFAVGFGFILLIIPGFIVLAGLSLSAQTLVIERIGVTDAMKRSWELSKGHRMQIFGFLFLMGIVSGVADYILRTIFLSNINLGNVRSVFMIYNISSTVVSALITPLTVCILILIYFNLRIKKEGFGLEHMVNQFSEASTEPTIEA